MDSGHACENDVIANIHVAGQGAVVRENTTVTHITIVRNVAIGHDQTIFANDRFLSVHSATVHGHTFTNGCVIANDGVGFLAIVLKVLWG